MPTSVVQVSDVLGSFSSGVPANVAGITQVPFDPKQLITGAGGFWRADVGVTQSSGNVSAWADQSTFSNNLTVVSATAPTWSSTGWLSAFPGVAFSHANSTYIANTSLTFTSSPASAFMLLSVTGTDALNFGWLTFVGTSGHQDATTSDSYTIIDQGSAGNPALEIAQASVGYGGNSMSTNTPYLIGVTFDGANLTPWFNAVGIPASDSLVPGGPSPVVVLGNRYLGALGGHAMDGTIAFAGITQRVLSQTDWNSLKSWSNGRFGTNF